MAAATQAQPEAQPQPEVPEITVITRVASIPIIASSLDQIHSTLSSNVLTRSPYHAAQVITQTAYNFSQPLQIRLAPFIVSANGYANKGLDVIEQKYPYPFKVKPEEVASYVRERRDSVVSSANERFDKSVKSPAVGVAEGIDKVCSLHVILGAEEINGAHICRNLPLLSTTLRMPLTRSAASLVQVRRRRPRRSANTSTSVY